jgi:hypothetical protein
MTTATGHVPYQHEAGIELSHFDKFYEKNLAWRTSGISALRHAEVNPFHVSIQDRGPDSPVAVYYLQDAISGEEFYWFEGDYKAAFEAFRARANEDNRYHVQLFVAVLKPRRTAEDTFLHHDPFGDEHGKTCHWADRYQSWQF